MLDNEINIENPEKKKIKKGVYLLPNLITSASLFGGFYAIIASLDGNFEYAAIAIIISGILDGLDGRIARLTGSSSKFGVEYDSLAHLIAHGLPFPAAAALICSTVLMFLYIGRGEEMVRHVTVLVLVYALAFLMISNVHYYSFKELNLSQRTPFRLLVGGIFLFIVVGGNPPTKL